jgi:hypothetical protein
VDTAGGYVVESHERCVATQAALSWAPEDNEKKLAKRTHRDAVRRFDRLVEAVDSLDAEVALPLSGTAVCRPS